MLQRNLISEKILDSLQNLEGQQKIVIQVGNSSSKIEDDDFFILDQKISFEEWTNLQSNLHSEKTVSFVGRQDFKVYKYANKQLKIQQFSGSSNIKLIYLKLLPIINVKEPNKYIRLVKIEEKDMSIHHFENMRVYPYEVNETIYTYTTSSSSLIKFYQIEKDGKCIYYYEFEILGNQQIDQIINLLENFI